MLKNKTPFFKNNLKKIRLSKNLTVKDLSEKVRMAQPNVSNLENDKSSLSLNLVETFAEALNCNPLEIITDIDTTNRIDDDIIDHIDKLIKNIDHYNKNYNKLIISLYNCFLDLKRSGVNLEKIHDAEFSIIIKTILNQTA